MLTVNSFRSFKKEGRKISMVTCYDTWSSKLLSRIEPLDCILVGDSAAMVMHGFPTTLQANTQMMAEHVAAVSRGCPNKFLIADMPFPTFRQSPEAAINHVDSLMKAGAHAVKLEGVYGHEEVIRHIVGSGVPVMGHLGLTPQSLHQLGGYQVQGREQKSYQDLILQAQQLEQLGAFAVVLECVPIALGAEITNKLQIPTIGIGAGQKTDGQVLVLQDLLGFNIDFKPRFLRTYLNGAELIDKAIKQFCTDVREGQFPSEKESYT